MKFCRFFLFFALLIFVFSCSAPKYDTTSLTGRSALIYNTNRALSLEDCTTALANIEALYNYSSDITGVKPDNEIRMARAAAHACVAGASNFFKMVGDVVANSALLAGAGFWKLGPKMFLTSDTDTLDKRITSSGFSTDALMATVLPGSVMSGSHIINSTTANPGTLIASDREVDANIELIFVSLATMGAIELRYGDADLIDYTQGKLLGSTTANPAGWADATKVTGIGCQYASAIVNLLDAIAETKNYVSASMKTNLELIETTFGAQMELACQAGCQGAAGTLNLLNYAVTGCNLSADECSGGSTRKCLLALRNRDACTGEITNAASCAAAGIIHYVNDDPFVGWAP